MFTRRGVFWSVGRVCVIIPVAAIALTAAEPLPAFAGASHGKAVSTASSSATDFSARRRLHRGGAAAAAVAAGVIGTGLAIAASQNRGAYYGYDGGPVYYGPTPYYGDPYYYGYDGYGSSVPYVNGHPIAGW